MPDLIRWSRDEITRMRREMDKLFDDLCVDFNLPHMVCRIAGDLHLREEGDVLVARLELDSISPDDVNVTVLDRSLVIQGESACIEGGKRRIRSFRKEVKLPCVIDTDKVKAEFEDGVLEVRLPKCASQQGHLVEISRK
ncbi:Hsp20/alpha crystallin family protein [Pseudodesulfovibrio tunisiensis]|uniref:Hsp20/alpha crystallin family protein n=1 Tax=Pseudodesulfovibrio tunisiensis TaxID=463192 RepID=UPI001FB32A0A|nr:Hsp20/alpha crystallin family protein [Pseudodesulfovibrio tunisiensis]